MKHIYGENIHGDNLNPHNINKLCCSHQSPQETQHLFLPEVCLGSVRPECQPSKIYESLAGKHIKYYNAGPVSQHPSLLDGNHHMSKYAWIGQGFSSVKKIPNHGHSITEVDQGGHDSSPNHMNGFLLSKVDWGAQHSCGNNLYDGGKNGEYSCMEICHGNSTKRHIKSHHTWKPFHHPCSLEGNQHIDTPHAFSNYIKATLDHGLSLSEVDWGDPKGESTKLGPSLMEADWGGKFKPNHITSECMLSEVDWGAHDSIFSLYLKLIDHDGEPNDFFTQGLWGGLSERKPSISLMDYLKDSLDTGQLKMDFSNSNQPRNIEVHTLFLTLNTLKVATTY